MVICDHIYIYAATACRADDVVNNTEDYGTCGSLLPTKLWENTVLSE